jgi:hypothetical protein
MMRYGRNSERGMIFIAALIMLSGMMVVVIAMAHEVSLDLKMSTNLMESEAALEIARVGLDNLLYLANNDSNWRTTYSSGAWISDRVVGDGKFTASGIDADGNLSDCPIDPVTATSVATLYDTTRTITATFQPPVHDAMMYLGSAWLGPITVEDAPRVYGDLSTGGSVTLVGSAPDFRGDLYVADKDVVAATLDDDDTDIHEISPTPGEPSVSLTWFTDRGTEISPPETVSDFWIENQVISPSSNPYGFANANGIYYFDAGNKEVRFRHCHITATIVITNAKTVFFEEASVHSPAFTYYPALVCNAPIVYSFDRNLSESTKDVDFNGDGDKSDVFTPFISGLVYSSLKITGMQAGGGTNIVRFKGVMISKRLHLIGSGSIFEQDPLLSTNLVNQFQGNGLRLVPGTLKLE